MANQRVDYQTAANPESPGDLDSGYTNNTAIRPVVDGQPGNAAVFTRPSENLRTRTEVIRTELEGLKYLSDADRALLIASQGSITWNGTGVGTFTSTHDIVIKPFMAPSSATAPRLIICAGTVGQITIRGKQLGVNPTPRAYNGANNIRFTFVPVISGTGAISIAQSETDLNFYTVTYDSHLVSGTTVNQLPGNSFIQQFNANVFMLAAGLEAVVEGGGVPPEVGFPTPPASVAATLLSDPVNGIQPAERATRYMSGALDSERHVIVPQTLVDFFAADGGTLNKLIEGDVLCIWYDKLVDGGGGRRESTLELPENSGSIPAGSLFLVRRFPERVPNAIPVATVVNGKLFFINGRAFISGESGPLTLNGLSYQGSTPNAWADSTTLAASSFETAIDNIVLSLGKTTASSGADKVGIQAITGVGAAAGTFSTTAGGVRNAIAETVAGANAHINLGTDAHAATAISAAAIAGVPYSSAGTTVQAAMAAINANINTHYGTGGANHAVATGGAAGFMSAADKTKLDAILSTAPNADNTPVHGGLIHAFGRSQDSLGAVIYVAPWEVWHNGYRYYGGMVSRPLTVGDVSSIPAAHNAGGMALAQVYLDATAWTGGGSKPTPTIVVDTATNWRATSPNVATGRHGSNANYIYLGSILVARHDTSGNPLILSSFMYEPGGWVSVGRDRDENAAASADLSQKLFNVLGPLGVVNSEERVYDLTAGTYDITGGATGLVSTTGPAFTTARIHNLAFSNNTAVCPDGALLFSGYCTTTANGAGATAAYTMVFGTKTLTTTNLDDGGDYKVQVGISGVNNGRTSVAFTNLPLRIDRVADTIRVYAVSDAVMLNDVQIELFLTRFRDRFRAY